MFQIVKVKVVKVETTHWGSKVENQRIFNEELSRGGTNLQEECHESI